MDTSEDVSDDQIAEPMEKMKKASAEDVPKIAEQIQVMLRKQGSKKGQAFEQQSAGDETGSR